MAEEAEPVDAEVVPEPETTPAAPAPPPAVHESTAVAVRPVGSTELISAASANERVEIATEIATALDAVIRKQGMRTKVGRMKVVREDGSEEWVDKWHVNVEGWQTLALLLGLAVIPGDPEPLRDDDGKVERASYDVVHAFYPKNTPYRDIKSGSAAPERVETAEIRGRLGYKCRVEVFKDGVLIGAGNGQCDREEEAWRDRPEYAIAGMAATRAQSRAIAATARWIVTLAGYSATPAEEYGQHEPQPVDTTPAADVPPFGPALPTEHREAVFALLVGVLHDNRDQAKAAAEYIKSKCGYMPAAAAHAIKAIAEALAAIPRDADGDPVPAEPEASPSPANDGSPIDAGAVHADAQTRKSGGPPPPPVERRPKEFENDPDPASTKLVMDAIAEGGAATKLPPGALRHLAEIPAAVGAWCSCSHAGRPGAPEQCLVHGIPF